MPDISEILSGIWGPIWYFIIILFGVELLVPRLWIVVEEAWWRLRLGNSTTSRLLRRYAMKDFQLSIKQREIDRSLPRPLAVLLAILARPFEMKRMTRELEGMKDEMIVKTFEATVKNLNAGWRQGKPPKILKDYIAIIEGSAEDKAIDPYIRHWGKCSVAVVKYALGDLEEGNRLGKKNWEEAKKLEKKTESVQKWLASYGYFNSTLFLGRFEEAMERMADQWAEHYAAKPDQKKALIAEVNKTSLILNPILAVPRHIILAAAFNETPIFAEKYWPSPEVYGALTERERTCKVKWVESWYAEAQDICQPEVTSLDFSHAYTGFYFTLLLLEEGRDPAYLHERIQGAFNAIKDPSPLVSRYAKYGFQGVYHLVCGQDQEALNNLTQASSLSAISGNRFADIIFMCCHAVAAARLNQKDKYLKSDIEYYLGEAKALARKINRPFYYKLWHGACAAVFRLEGFEARAQKEEESSRQGASGNRILGIFQNNAPELRSRNDAREIEAHEDPQETEPEEDRKE